MSFKILIFKQQYVTAKKTFIGLIEGCRSQKTERVLNSALNKSWFIRIPKELLDLLQFFFLQT